MRVITMLVGLFLALAGAPVALAADTVNIKIVDAKSGPESGMSWVLAS